MQQHIRQERQLATGCNTQCESCMARAGVSTHAQSTPQHAAAAHLGVAALRHLALHAGGPRLHLHTRARRNGLKVSEVEGRQGSSAGQVRSGRPLQATQQGTL